MKQRVHFESHHLVEEMISRALSYIDYSFLVNIYQHGLDSHLDKISYFTNEKVIRALVLNEAMLDYCCWDSNSITAYDYLKLSLIEAYNSVYSYDLIALVETHLDNSCNVNKLALN